MRKKKGRVWAAKKPPKSADVLWSDCLDSVPVDELPPGPIPPGVTPIRAALEQPPGRSIAPGEAITHREPRRGVLRPSAARWASRPPPSPATQACQLGFPSAPHSGRRTAGVLRAAYVHEPELSFDCGHPNKNQINGMTAHRRVLIASDGYLCVRQGQSAGSADCHDNCTHPA